MLCTHGSRSPASGQGNRMVIRARYLSADCPPTAHWCSAPNTMATWPSCQDRTDHPPSAEATQDHHRTVHNGQPTKQATHAREESTRGFVPLLGVEPQPRPAHAQPQNEAPPDREQATRRVDPCCLRVDVSGTRIDATRWH